MEIQPALKKRRVGDDNGTIAAMSPSLASISREVSPPQRSTAADALSVAPAGTWRWPTSVPSMASTDDDTEDEGETDVARQKPKPVDEDDEDEDALEAPNSFDRSTRTVHARCNDTFPQTPISMSDGLRFKGARHGGSRIQHGAHAASTTYVPSQFQLTHIRDLPPTHNADTVTLHEILGHPLLTECWQFNYLHSIAFILEHFDPDTRPHINLKIVHGFWRNDDTRKHKLQEQQELAVKAGAKVQLIAAHMPEMFGTHHSKMMILLRADGVAQIVIHTANMIPQDWRNLTQAVWKSPELPLLSHDQQQEEDWRGVHPVGSGLRFKADLLEYLRAYEGRTKSLMSELSKYDFSSVKAALVSSTPGKRPIEGTSTQLTTAFGWPGLKTILAQIPNESISTGDNESIVNVQISSIATLTQGWIQNFFNVLSTRQSQHTPGGEKQKTKFKVIFPTAEEIRKSLDGYSSGDSIHMKLHSVAQQKQLHILKPLLHHWRSNLDDVQPDDELITRSQASRNAAAPHIKTYIRFTDAKLETIDWAMITSANLSQQAWGWTTDKNNRVRIASYEIGVVVWPDLFKGDDEKPADVVMVPTFGRDMPEAGDVRAGGVAKAAQIVIGVRMPYDLPLVPYGKTDIPWCATMAHEEPDWMGNVWGGYENRV